MTKSHRQVRQYFSNEYDVDEPITPYDISDVIDQGDFSFYVLQAIDDVDDEEEQELLKEKIRKRRFGL